MAKRIIQGMSDGRRSKRRPRNENVVDGIEEHLGRLDGSGWRRVTVERRKLGVLFEKPELFMSCSTEYNYVIKNGDVYYNIL